MPVTVTRSRTTKPRSRRFSACHRHPTEHVTGFCALCLRDRLAGLDSDSGQLETVEKVFVSSRQTRGHAAASLPAPEFRRSKSVAAGKCEVLNDLVTDVRRKSCDVTARSSLSDLFVVDDHTKKLGFPNDDKDEIRVSDDVIERNEIDDSEIDEGDLKTMKEIIETELKNKRRNFWESASVFSQKLRKWRQKQKEKKEMRRVNGGSDVDRSKLGQTFRIRDNESEVGEYKLGRRSCDTEPMFSIDAIDAGRLSVEDSRLSFDEHRASWDGYMIARTIPHLTPMLSTVDSMILGLGNRVAMHSISEDGGSSGGSNESVLDSSSSNRGSSSSSLKSLSTKTAGFSGDDVKSVSNARVSPANDFNFEGTKLVITEKELKDWHLNSVKNNKNNESVSDAPNLTSEPTVTNPSNGHKMVVSSRWKKVCNLWGHKHKLDDKNGEKKNVDVPENRVETGNSSVNLVRNLNLVKSRNRSTRYSTSDLDNGLLRLYLTPFRNSRRNKSGRNRVPSMATNGL